MALDAHARPPESMRRLYKKWQKSSLQEIEASKEIIDLSSQGTNTAKLPVHQVTGISAQQQWDTFHRFLSPDRRPAINTFDNEPLTYELDNLSGLCMYPSFLSPGVQVELLNKLLHRDLPNASHKSNLHLHYDIPYSSNVNDHVSGASPQSFFEKNQTDLLHPKDHTLHKSLTMKQVLERKLRWVTLGGQYDWTAKVYPSEVSPVFPEDIACLLKGLFPDVDAQAAIVNFYTPGDTLSVHRDVSEECDRGLISISIGCDALFVIGNNEGTQAETIRLRSGDAVLMSGQSRYAWHAVPKVISQTCPGWLRDWPASDHSTAFESWRGWIANKRINVNVRQMHE